MRPPQLQGHAFEQMEPHRQAVLTLWQSVFGAPRPNTGMSARTGLLSWLALCLVLALPAAALPPLR